MPESSLALFFIATLVLALAPGPDLLYITTRGLDQGAVAGLISALGVHTGVLIHTIIAALGLSALIASSAIAFAFIKYTGAAYLCFLGLTSLVSWPGATVSRCQQAISRAGLRKVFYQGVITDVLNPKVILFFLAFFPQFVDPASDSAPIDIFLLGLVFVAVAFPIDAVVGLFAGSISKQLSHSRQHRRWGKWMTGSAFIILGIGTAFTSPPS